MNKEIDDVYYDPSKGLANPQKIYYRLKRKIPYDRIRSYINDQKVNQVMREQRKPKFYNTIMASFPGDIYQMDVIVYNRHKYNDYKYILTMIDVYSRLAQAIPLTGMRLEEDIIPATKEALKKFGKIPDNISCDNQFNSKIFTDIFPKDTSFWFSDADEINKNAIIERFNRTLARYIQLVRLASGKDDWPSYIDSIVKNYNTSYHSGIRNIPEEVWNGNTFPIQRVRYVENKFKPGDNVRIKIKEENKFVKGDRLRYSHDVFTVKSIKGNRVFVLDGNGKPVGPKLGFKPYELIKTSAIVTIPVAIEKEQKQYKFKDDKFVEIKGNKQKYSGARYLRDNYSRGLLSKLANHYGIQGIRNTGEKKTAHNMIATMIHKYIEDNKISNNQVKQDILNILE